MNEGKVWKVSQANCTARARHAARAAQIPIGRPTATQTNHGEGNHVGGDQRALPEPRKRDEQDERRGHAGQPPAAEDPPGHPGERDHGGPGQPLECRADRDQDIDQQAVAHDIEGIEEVDLHIVDDAVPQGCRRDRRRARPGNRPFGGQPAQRRGDDDARGGAEEGMTPPPGARTGMGRLADARASGSAGPA